jgi:CBS domain-containing protein
MKARDIMTKDVLAVTPEDHVTRAAHLMLDFDVGLIPVVADQVTRRLVGVITDRDITVRHTAHGHRANCEVGEHMSSAPLHAVRPDDHAHDVIGRMRHEKIRRMPVIDDEHRLVGIIAQADIALALGDAEPRLVEQMLADISEPASIGV